MRCAADEGLGPPNLDTSQYPLEKLSDYRFFTDLAAQEPNDVLARIMGKVEKEKAASGAAFESPFAEITDEDIDSLFSE